MNFKSKLTAFRSQVLKFDRFAAQYKMNLSPSGTNSIPSLAGACSNILIMMLLLTYAAYRMSYLWSMQGIQMLQTVKNNYFKQDDVFGVDQGLAVAVAIMDEDDLTLPLDPGYGSIKAFVSEWGFRPNEEGQQEYYAEHNELESHTCTPEELGLTESHSTFLPVEPQSLSSFQEMTEKFLCLDKKDAYIFGSYDNDIGRMIEFQLQRCMGEDYCYEQEQITDYFKGKFIGLLTNRIRFDANFFGEESIIPESTLIWLPISV